MYKIIFFFIITYIGFSKPTNLEIQDSLISDFYEKIIKDTDTGTEDFVINIENHNASWLFEQKGINKFIEAEIKYNDSSDFALNIYIKKIKPEYDAISKDSIKRTICLQVSYSIQENEEYIFSDNYETKYSDIIEFQEISIVENENYLFTKGNTPEIPASFWTEYAEPAIVMSAAIITVILFFTVRS